MFHTPIVAADAPPVTPAAFRQRMLVETGQRYAAFRKTLAPDYTRVAIDIALGYAALTGWLVLVGQASGVFAGIGAACVGAVGVGFLVAYLQLFIHEGAHCNLAATREDNDRIADWLICWQVGTSIAAYRATHAEHHRHLGRDGDTEVSYRQALTPRFVAEMLTGVHAVRVFGARKHQTRARAAVAESRTPLLRGLYLHAAIVGTLLWLGWWPALLAWLGGIAVALPFFGTIRPMLEHRPTPGMHDDGDAVTRLFGDNPLARIFGGAGFNRHLLHHLEPQVSYTRLGELETFLNTTSMAGVLDARRASYLGTFAELIRERAR
jgi:fatty acid desaturase